MELQHILWREIGRICTASDRRCVGPLGASPISIPPTILHRQHSVFADQDGHTEMWNACTDVDAILKLCCDRWAFWKSLLRAWDEILGVNSRLA